MESNRLGTTTIAPAVIGTIARLTALAVPGVKSMSKVRAPHKKGHGTETDGVRAIIKNDQLFLDIYLVTSADVNVRLVSETVQQKVFRAVTEMTGTEVAQVNVHITDVDFEA